MSEKSAKVPTEPCAICSGQWVRIEPALCDLCSAPAVWRNALGGLRCECCPRPESARASTVMGTMKRGWGWPALSKRAHYFVDGRSLCGRWGYFGDVSDKDAAVAGPDDCAMCRRRYDKNYRPSEAPAAAQKEEERR